MIELPRGFLVLFGIAVYSVVNGCLIGYQLKRYFKIDRLGYLCKMSVIQSIIASFLLLICQGLFLVYAFRIERLFTLLSDCDWDNCPVTINEDRLIMQASFCLIVIFATIKAAIQAYMLLEEYHIKDKILWRMLAISGAAACMAQYIALSNWF